MIHAISSKDEKLRAELERLFAIDPVYAVVNNMPFRIHYDQAEGSINISAEISTYNFFIHIYDIKYTETYLDDNRQVCTKLLYTYEFHWIEEFEEWLKIYN